MRIYSLDVKDKVNIFCNSVREKKGYMPHCKYISKEVFPVCLFSSDFANSLIHFCMNEIIRLRIGKFVVVSE